MNIKQCVHDNVREITGLHQYFHMYPELSTEEFSTMEYIQKKLKEYNIPSVHIEKGGILGIIDSGKPGKTLLLRADIDALPITESDINISKQKKYISQNKGIMHACGHDGHTAMLLVEGKILQENRNEWEGKVVLMFEEGEENGSRYLLQFFAYFKKHAIHVDGCYGTHVRWDIPSGKIGIITGPAMAGVFAFDITLMGIGGHGSRPDLAVNPIDCFAAIYNGINTIRMRNISPQHCLTVSIGKLKGGERINVISDMLEFGGTVRYFDENDGKQFKEKLERILENECSNFGCRYIVNKKSLNYVLRNNEDCARIACNSIAKNLGENVLYAVQPWMASESMALTLRVYPGVFSFTGIANTEIGSGANHHTAAFDIDDAGLVTGVAAAISYSLAFLAYTQPIPFTAQSIEQA